MLCVWIGLGSQKKREEEQEKIRFRGVNIVSVYRKDITAGFFTAVEQDPWIRYMVKWITLWIVSSQQKLGIPTYRK